MKILKWIVALIPLAITAAVLPMMPEQVPMHYDINGAVDRMGSRYELFLLPVIIILVVAVSGFTKAHYEKRAETSDGSEAKSARMNARVLKISSFAVPVIFGALQCGVLYMTYRNAKAENVEVNSDLIVRLSVILIGIMCVVFGIIMPKTERNNVFGFRVTWSMYNENTWKKCNTFGGIVFVIIGMLMIISSAIVPAAFIIFLMLGYLLVGTVVMLVYSCKVYKEEKASESAQK